MGPLTVVQRTCPGLTACHLPRPQAQAGASPASMSTPRSRAVPQWRLLCMDGTAFGVMKYSQVSDSLRNDGDQSIPFQGVIFFPFTACFMLTIISMSKGLDRRRLSELRTSCRLVRGVSDGAWARGVEPGQDTPVGWQVGSHGRLSQGCGGLAGGSAHPALLGLANLPGPWTGSRSGPQDTFT